MTGGCGLLHRFGPRRHRPEIDQLAVVFGRRPWVQISFIASTRSRTRVWRVAKSVPWFSISSRFQPLPIPNRNRPLEIWSIEATSFAVWIGSRWFTRHTPVPTSNVFVAIAATVSVTNGSITS